MNLDIWNSCRNNTNVNEGAYHSINLDGTSLSLLAAIKRLVGFYLKIGLINNNNIIYFI